MNPWFCKKLYAIFLAALLAALLAAGLAYALGPSATLLGPFAPAAGPPPGTGVCNNPAVPAPAAAAGYNTLYGCWDFTQPQFTDMSTWVDCKGATNPQWWTRVFLGPPTVNCGAYNMVNDGGVQVLDLRYTPTDAAAGSSGNQFTSCQWALDVPCNANMPLFHPGYYIEIVFRITDASFQNVRNGSVTNFVAQFYANCTNHCNNVDLNYTIETDWFEYFVPSPPSAVGRSGCIIWNSGVPSGCGTPGDYPLPVEPTSGYSTIAVLITMDTSYGFGMCSFLNGALIGGVCNVVADNFLDPVNATNHSYIQLVSGGNGNPNTQDFYIKSIRFWACATVATGACFHSIITSPPNP